MKKILPILSLFLLCNGLFAQDSANLEELRLFTRSTLLKGEMKAREVGADSVVLGEILYEGNSTSLGQLLVDLLTAEITNNSTLELLSNPSALRESGDEWLIINGVIHTLDNVVYMQLRIVDSSDQTPLAVLEKTLAYPPFAELLYVDSYQDDYYEEPVVVREDYAMEPNNDLNSAVEYIPGDSYELALTPWDEDWFFFTVEEESLTSDAFLVEIYTTGTTDTYMTVYGPDDPNLYYGESDDYIDGNAGMPITLDAPGTFWVVISGYSDETNGYYGLESYTSPVEFADEYEPNNTWERATVLTGDEVQEHAFGLGDVLDTFQFTQAAFGEVTLYTEGMLDTYMDLYDEYGNYIASDDDGGKDSNARLEIDLNQGKYFVEVRPYDESGSGNYQMFLERE
ncbi:MAG: hypothetical protein PQJ59_01460 [Spirochaetales bacterium]|nr:hypothetical protein [Spirochaetales bacterium]